MGSCSLVCCTNEQAISAKPKEEYLEIDKKLDSCFDKEDENQAHFKAKEN
jgi:hypothetical protein